MENYIIKFAEYDDITAIMKYIDDYWKKGHILATNRVLFEWQYVYNNRVNIVIAVDDGDNIQGILGFAPYGSGDDKDIALALWKANQTGSFLGIRLLLFLKKEERHRHIVCPGVNIRTTAKIYKQIGMTVNVMKQWYRLRDGARYVIGKIEDAGIPQVDGEQYGLQLLTDSKQLRDWNFFDNPSFRSIPFKSKEYLEKRYFDHPSYEYQVYAIKDCDL